MKYSLLLWSALVCLPAFGLEKPAFLFVCTGNTGRSPMAEALANEVLHFDTQGYPTISRGLNVKPDKTSREANAITVMHELGANKLGTTQAQALSSADIQAATWVLTMTQAQKDQLLLRAPQARAKIKTLSECATGREQDVEDAYGHDVAFYRQTREQIATYLLAIEQHGFRCLADKT